MCPPRHPIGLVSVILGVALMAPNGASASTVVADIELEEDIYRGTTRFMAGRGEQNRLTVRYGRWGVVFHDGGSRIRARDGCKSLGRHTATCVTSDSEDASVSLNDGDDDVKLRDGFYASVTGGPGDDRMAGGREVGFYGGAGDDVLQGSPGPDVLSGGPGRDRMFSRGEDDLLFDGESDAQAAPDLVDGGSDDDGDEIFYTRRRKSVRIVLGDKGRASEDTIIGVENASGGMGDDRLIGDDDPNVLGGSDGSDVVRGGGGDDAVYGGRGDDRVFGGRGRDAVSGDAGRDRLVGNAGDDVLSARSPGDEPVDAPDVLACGAGADKVVTDPVDMLTARCERLWSFDPPMLFLTAPELRQDSAAFRFRCQAGRRGRCTGTLSLKTLPDGARNAAPFDAPRGSGTASVPLGVPGFRTPRPGSLIQVGIRPSDPSRRPSGYRMHLPAR